MDVSANIAVGFPVGRSAGVPRDRHRPGHHRVGGAADWRSDGSRSHARLFPEDVHVQSRPVGQQRTYMLGLRQCYELLGTL